MQDTSPPKRRQASNSLARKSLFVVLGATVLTALAVGGVSLYSGYDGLRRSLDSHQPARLAAVSQGVSAWLSAGGAALVPLARELDPTQLEQALADSEFFEALVIVDAHGQKAFAASLASEPAAGLPKSLASAQIPVGEVRPWITPHDADAGPILASTRLPGGVTLHASFRRETLVKLLASNQGSTQGRVCLLDASGRVRASLCSTPETTSATKPVGLLSSDRSQLYTNADGSRVFGAARPLEGLEEAWLLIEEPATSALAPLVTMAVRSLVVGLCVILLVSFAAHRISLATFRPLRALYQAARRIAAGELDFELEAVSGNDELAHLTGTFNEMTGKLRAHKTSVESGAQMLKVQNDELQRANEVLEQLSITDGLTRLHNHRFFQDHLTREIKRVSRTREPLSMLVCDIDDFKRLNDHQGHKAGDELLVGLARIMNESIRENDFLARYGGEEFVVLAPVTDVEGAVALAEKIRRAVEDSPFILADSKQLTRVTLSIGVAQYKGNRRSFFQAADQALYRAKAAGKNCVIPEE